MCLCLFIVAVISVIYGLAIKNLNKLINSRKDLMIRGILVLILKAIVYFFGVLSFFTFGEDFMSNKEQVDYGLLIGFHLGIIASVLSWTIEAIVWFIVILVSGKSNKNLLIENEQRQNVF